MSHRTWYVVRLDTNKRVAIARHVTSSAWLKRAAQKVANKLGVQVALVPHDEKKDKRHLNPAPGRKPVKGETWTDNKGRPMEILSVANKRVYVKFTRTGNRDYIDLAEFAGFSPGRQVTRNARRAPKRKGRMSPSRYGHSGQGRGKRAESLTVHADYWIELATPDELAADPRSPYRMVTTGGQRFALSAGDAIRAQKEGLEFRGWRNPARSRTGGAWGVSGIGVTGAKVWLSRSGYWTATKTTAGRWSKGEADNRARQSYEVGAVERGIKIEPLSGKAAAPLRRRRAPRARGGRHNPNPKGRKAASGTCFYAHQGETHHNLGNGYSFNVTGWYRWGANGHPVGPYKSEAACKRSRRAPNPTGRWAVADARGRVFWRGAATSRDEALMSAERSKAGKSDPPEPWTAKRAPNPKRRKSPRSNPRPFSQRQQAEAMFQKWHEFPSERTRKVKIPSRTIPKVVAHLGKVVRIDYISDKWEGKPVTYTHSTKRPYPELVSAPDGRQLYLVGGRMKPTADGLVN